MRALLRNSCEAARIRHAQVEISHRILEGVKVKLREHCKLQGEQGYSRCCDGQEPLRDPRNQICAVVHVCILVD
jgi:hypothetical protein